MMLLALMVPALACEAPTRTSDVLEATGRAEVAYTSMDAAAFEAALADARQDLGCLGEPIGADGAAAYHRAEGLGAFLAGDSTQAGEFFEAARAALPGWRLPGSMAPEGHPLRAVFDAATPGTERFALAPGGEVAWYQVDGRRQPDAPTDRPFVLQRFRTDGAVLSTAVAARDTYVPDAPPEPEPVAEPLPVEPMPQPARGARIGLGVGAGVLALGAGAAFTAAALAHDRYWDPTTPPDHLARLQTTTNAATIGGAVLAAGAVGCATGAVFVARF